MGGSGLQEPHGCLVTPAQVSVGLGFDAGWVERLELPGDCCCDWQNRFPPKADEGAEERGRGALCKVYQPLVAEPAKQEGLLKLCPWPVRVFSRTEHCSLSTASGGAAHGFHAPPALMNKHLLANLQLQPLPVPNSPGAGADSEHLH